MNKGAWSNLDWRSIMWRWRLHVGRWCSLVGVLLLSIAGYKLSHGYITGEEFMIIVPVVMLGVVVFGTLMWLVVEACHKVDWLTRFAKEIGPIAAILGIVITFGVIGYFVERGAG